MIFNCPISIEKANLIISVLKLKPTDRVIDLGCGNGEFLSLIQKKYDSDCLGLDVDASCITLAKQKAQQHALTEKIHFELADVQEVPLEKNSYQLATCIGSTHAFGHGESAYLNSIKKMIDLVRPHGLILVGEGYWKQKPVQTYLDFIGDPVGIYNTHDKNIQQAESLGLIPLYAAISNLDEWDHFEWSFRMNAERQALAEPKDEKVKKKLERVRKWNQYYRKFGRETMGFGYYLFMKNE